MNYRIRYRHGEGARDNEVTVEANSPNEAMVKFRCIQEPRPHGSSTGHEITSVTATERSESQMG